MQVTRQQVTCCKPVWVLAVCTRWSCSAYMGALAGNGNLTQAGLAATFSYLAWLAWSRACLTHSRCGGEAGNGTW